MFLQNAVRKKTIAVRNLKKATVAKNAPVENNKVDLQILKQFFF